MNEGAHPESPSGFLLGKEFIIVLVIVFSGLSFTLGYFVGKNAVEHQAIPTTTAAAGTVQQNRQEPVVVPSDQAEEIAHAGSSLPTVQGVAAENELVVAVQDEHDRNSTDAVSHEQKKSAVPPKNAVKAASHADTGNTSVTIVPETATDEKTKRYTVQIGAFKNAADATLLKTRFQKKGYKPFVSQVQDPNGHKIYKVKTGDFRDKKDADLLALKLKKTEGLHAYVTTRTE